MANQVVEHVQRIMCHLGTDVDVQATLKGVSADVNSGGVVVHAFNEVPKNEQGGGGDALGVKRIKITLRI